MRRVLQAIRPGSWQGKRIWLLAAIMLGLTVAGLAAWWLLAESPARREDRTLKRVQQERLLRVGLDASYPPFEDIDEDTKEIFGFDVDLAREVGRRLGAEVEIANIGFDGLYEALTADKVDVLISGLPYDARMTEDVAYSVAYFNAGQVLVVRQDNTTIRETGDLAGRSLAVEWGSTADMEARQLVKKLPGLKPKLYPSAQDALVALKGGQSDAALVDAISAYQFIGQEGGLKAVGRPLTDELYVIAVRPQSRKLLSQINDILLKMRVDGTLERLQIKWLGAKALPL
jgi:polar amino acid transport system substrate-binding protein